MPTGLPPPPLRNDVGDFSWLDWYNKLYKYLNTAGAISWSQIDFTGSKLSDIQSRPHADLTNIQGGTAGERYHLTQAEHDGLTNGGSTTLHTHAHNNLSSVQGGLSTERYHMSQAEYDKVHTQPWIEVADTNTSSLALTTTPVLLAPPTTVSGSGISYDSSTGVFTFPYAGSYDLSLHVNATASASNQFVYIYAENNTGSGWTVNANSGKLYELINSTTVQIIYAQSVHRVAGQQVRYKIYSNSNKVTLGTSTLPGGVGAIVPAIRIQYAG